MTSPCLITPHLPVYPCLGHIDFEGCLAFGHAATHKEISTLLPAHALPDGIGCQHLPQVCDSAWAAWHCLAACVPAYLPVCQTRPACLPAFDWKPHRTCLHMIQGRKPPKIRQ